MEKLKASEDYLIILRFFGTTRDSSSILNNLFSIIEQLDLYFQFDGDKSNLSKLSEVKAYLVAQLNKIQDLYPQKKLIFFLDSIDQLRSGDYSLSWMIKQLPTNVKMIYSTLTEHGNILERVQQTFGFDKQKNFVKIDKLNLKTSLFILSEWLKKANRALTREQTGLIERLFERASLYPLYVRLQFDIISKWPSYYMPTNLEEFQNCLNIDECIKYLFKGFELKHGRVLFARCCVYLNLFRNGVTETEIEDILSIDDDVLYSVLKYHHPPKRRFPFYLWVLIKNDIQDYLSVKAAADGQVISWFHRRFFEVIDSMYISSLAPVELDQICFNVIDYYAEKWNKQAKPFEYSEHVRLKLGLETVQSAAVRFTKQQNIELTSIDGQVRFNERKLNELPFFVIKLNNIELKVKYLIEFIYFNYAFMRPKAILQELDFLDYIGPHIWSIYNQLDTSGQDLGLKKAVSELALLHYFYSNDSLILETYPKSFYFQICSKLIQMCHRGNRFYEFLTSAFREASKHCSLIMPYSYLPLMDKTKASTLIYDYKHFQYIVNCSRSNYIFASSNQIYFVDTVKAKLVDKFDSLELCETFAFIRKFCVYFRQPFPPPDVDTFKLNDLNGGVLIRQRTKLFSFDFSKKLLFKKVYNTRIVDLFLLSTSCVLVQLDHSFGVEILNVNDSTMLCERKFSHAVKLVKTNTNEQDAFYTEYEALNIFVCVLLQSGQIHVFKFDNRLSKLILLSILPEQGLEPLSVVSDNYFHPRNRVDRQFPSASSDVSARFAVLFKKGCLSIVTLKYRLGSDKKTRHIDVAVLNLKFDANSHKSFKPLGESNKICLEDFFDNRILIQVLKNCYLYNNGE
jgi:hypothetical protein